MAEHLDPRAEVSEPAELARRSGRLGHAAWAAVVAGISTGRRLTRGRPGLDSRAEDPFRRAPEFPVERRTPKFFEIIS